MAFYGARTRNAAGVETLNTSTMGIRSIVTVKVTVPPITSDFTSFINMPEITATSFVCVTLQDASNSSSALPAVFWSTGQLRVRRGAGIALNVFILTYQ
ncbi:hypothetical protein [Pseudomonas chlororaphis]|uniref:Uncharacterized protein n=1 Tax=Pseudomonas chlororaphis O6 TaxID=1037915 RepID=A0AB33WST2_9PSED|nr:hypothetical protein [Pseudomonas chlororaphis]EIM16231.1 hypothetical protein PchlO6_1259 [Pseudomonas chlororaphis O6]